MKDCDSLVVVSRRNTRIVRYMPANSTSTEWLQ